MAQMHERFCSNCGSPVAADQRFCSNCGATMDAGQPTSPPPTQYPPYQQNQPYPQQQQQYRQSWEAPPANQQVPSYAQAPQTQQQGKTSPIAEAFAALGLLFLLRRSQRDLFTGRQRRRSSGCCGVIVFLLILAIIAVPIILIARSASPSVLKNLSSSGGSNTDLTTQPPITTMHINQTVPYAGINITIVNVQQSKAFRDDSYSKTDGMVRLNIREQGTTSRGGYYYGDVVRLILSDNSSVAPINEQQALSPNTGVSRTNWLDFPVPTSVKISQLTLQLGKASEAQLNIPLTGKADVGQYQPKTANPNVKTQYAGMTWTITSATTALSAKGQQADKGMLFVTVTLKVDNPSSQDFRGYWGDYIRLKSGDTTSSPTTDSDFPLSVAAGTTGTTGSLIFLMPQGSSSYTLILLNTPSTNYSQAMVDFQV